MSKNVFDIFNFKKNNVLTADIEQVINFALFESSSTVNTGTEKQSNKHLKHNKLTISDLGTLDTGPVRPLLKVSIFSFYLYL